MNGSSLCARRARARLEILKTPSPYSTEEVSSASSCQSLPPTHASFKTCAFTAPKKGRVRARGHHPNIEQLRNLQLNKYLFTDSGVSLAKMKQMADQRELYSDKDAAQHNTAGCHVRVCVCVCERPPLPLARSCMCCSGEFPAVTWLRIHCGRTQMGVGQHGRRRVRVQGRATHGQKGPFFTHARRLLGITTRVFRSTWSEKRFAHEQRHLPGGCH